VRPKGDHVPLLHKYIMGGVKTKSKPTLHCTWHIGSPPKDWQDNAPFLGGGYIRQVFSVK